ncbi:MAG: hypothetical protein LBH49_00425 [Puniceicoccales bacterium]|jgi:predicted  nucleic acid-binding Zn-ribbon protein|nr:hypothetical protein [Puniceicoccales bacterium]
MIGREEVNLILILQGYDSRLVSVSEKLKNLPKERAKIERAMVDEKKKLSDLKASSSAAEMEFNRVNFEMESMGQKLIELKVKQASVKKKEEYALLQNQIISMEEKIEQLENDSVMLLYSLDDLKVERDRMATEVDLCLNRFSNELLQNRLLQEDLEKNISELNAKIGGMRKTVANENLLRMYDLARQGVKRMPVVVVVMDGRCKGCNIRISNDTLVALRRTETFCHCEACGRLLYMEPSDEIFDGEND